MSVAHRIPSISVENDSCVLTTPGRKTRAADRGLIPAVTLDRVFHIESCQRLYVSWAYKLLGPLIVTRHFKILDFSFSFWSLHGFNEMLMPSAGRHRGRDWDPRQLHPPQNAWKNHTVQSQSRAGRKHPWRETSNQPKKENIFAYKNNPKRCPLILQRHQQDIKQHRKWFYRLAVSFTTSVPPKKKKKKKSARVARLAHKYSNKDLSRLW